MVDKNLFIYDLAVVAIMKNEAPYVKEWLDYHLLAGVDHFFIYDNESHDNLKEILQPYIEAEIVTYTFYPGKLCQIKSYTDAIKRFKFFCRYIAFIDGDEFIFPKSKPTIAEVVDEIIGGISEIGGLAINWNMYGSNGHEKADLSRGVLERFTSREKDERAAHFPNAIGNEIVRNATVKVITNPRRVNYFLGPHNVSYFTGHVTVNELRRFVSNYSSYPISTEKIVVNHYYLKSFEEYQQKIKRGRADILGNNYEKNSFHDNDFNDIFDDSILKYRDARRNALTSTGGGESLSI